MKKTKLGIVSFVELTNDYNTYEERILNAIEEIKYADELGLDFFGIGEHHRKDYAVSSPITILAAAASVTKNITLSPAVVVLSSEDPIRLIGSSEDKTTTAGDNVIFLVTLAAAAKIVKI